MLLLSKRFNLVEPTIATFGWKFLFFKLHGNQAVRLMRMLRDCGYLSLLTDADRGRMLLFLLQLRVSAATQEAIACIFESSSPMQSEALMRHVGVRLLRFSCGGTYWRRCISGLANPYVSPIAVAGLEPFGDTITDDGLGKRAKEVECLLRGEAGSRPVPYLGDTSRQMFLTNITKGSRDKGQYAQVPYSSLASSLHSGDLLFIWRNEKGMDTLAEYKDSSLQVGETLLSRHRKHQPQLAVVIGMEHMRGGPGGGHPLILTASLDPHALKQVRVRVRVKG